jgi:hypothetical protein
VTVYEPDVEILFRQQFRHEVPPGTLCPQLRFVRRVSSRKLDGGVGEEIMQLVSDVNMPGVTGLNFAGDEEGGDPTLAG